MNPFITVPRCIDGVWDSQTFETREEFRDLLDSIWQEPGKYDFNEVSYRFNEEGSRYFKNKLYCAAPRNSIDYIAYWDKMKDRCINGVLFMSTTTGTTKTWYIPRGYYMWLNFLPIYDKEKGDIGFAKVRDAQYHMALYECRAWLWYKHAVILKKRQIASSYFHSGILINKYWFDRGSVCKIGAALSSYIDETGTWGFLNEYRDFLNENTAWYRPSDPGTTFAWQQRVKVRIKGRDTYRGRKSKLNGTSFEKKATAGVGGPCDIFFHEEGGIAPKAMETYVYMKQAMRSGMLTTGLFIIAGSVGDLDQCGPIKTMMYDPEANGFLGVETNLIDEKGTIGITGLFIPEQWSMLPCIDKFGNSLVEDALKVLAADFAKKKKEMLAKDYQLEVSQRPRNIDEAFATRKLPKFPPHLVTAQIKRLENKEFPLEFVDLSRDELGKIVIKASKRFPITEFPVGKKTVDKEGVIVIHERPIKNAVWGTYYGSIDPVGEGRTTTSDSLCSIHIWKNDVELIKNEGNGKFTHEVERGKMVAWWCGRFDDLKKTHERLELMLEYYNAWTVIEANVSLFIQYMISRRKQKYLVTKEQMLFLKDLTNKSSYQDYGWKNTGTFFKTHLLNYAIESLLEEIDTVTSPDGEIIRITYGVERIMDIMLLREMQQYVDGLNVDRLVSYAALIAFVTVQLSNRGLQKRLEVVDDDLDTSTKMTKLNRGAFRHLGGNSAASTQMRQMRQPFRNYR